jgi:methionyl aminopeptidase
MVRLKSEQELSKMRTSGKLVAQILEQVARLAVPGTELLELDRIAERLTREAGAVPAFKGYHGFQHTLCLSVNEQVVHGIPTRRRLKDGDILSVDFGLVLDGFFGDSAVTLPIGNVSPAAKRLLAVTKEALYAGIAAARVGNTLRDIGRAVEQVAKAGRCSVVRDFVGHGIGEKLHEDPPVPNYAVGAPLLPLKAGMTLAIEPMINLGGAAVKVLPDGWTAVTVDGSLSAHFEHTIAIRPEGDAEILTEWSNGSFGHVAPPIVAGTAAPATAQGG